MPIKVWNNLERKKNQINKYPYSTSHSLPLRWLVTGLAKTTAHQEVGSPSETRFAVYAAFRISPDPVPWNTEVSGSIPASSRHWPMALTQIPPCPEATVKP